jgi:hypothetical protein
MPAGEIVGFCMKEKKKRKMAETKKYMMGKNKDRAAVKGVCSVCGCKMNKILSAEDKKNI